MNWMAFDWHDFDEIHFQKGKKVDTLQLAIKITESQKFKEKMVEFVEVIVGIAFWSAWKIKVLNKDTNVTLSSIKLYYC